MNAERAYEQHTALIRALTRPDSPTRAHFNAYHESIGINPLSGEKQAVIALGDPGWAAIRAKESAISNVSVVVGFQPDDPSEDPVEDVGVLDPALPGGVPVGDTDSVPDLLAFPRPVLTDTGVAAMAHGPTIYVTSDMVTVLEHATAALDDTDQMPFHPAYPSGFAVLSRPLRLPYGDGTDQVIHAFGWTSWPSVRTVLGGTGRAGMVWQFVDRTEAPTDRGSTSARRFYPSSRAWSEAPDLVLNIADQFVTGSPVGRPLETATEVNDYSERLRLALHDHLPETPPSVAVQRPDGETYGRFQPYLAAFLLLLSQDISVQREEAVTDYARKRATRAGRSDARDRSSSVTVVDLAPRRRGDSTGPGESGQRLTARHLVGSHWKWQPYGPNRRLRRRIYVADYVRGPDEMPLIVKPRVRRL